MIQNQLVSEQDLCSIGKEIGYELGVQMTKEFQNANPDSIQCFFIGRNILDQILAQPGCVGIQLIKGLNHSNEETLVYVGTNSQGKAIINFSSVNTKGELEAKKGIVADYIRRRGNTEFEESDIEWGLPE